MKEMNLTKFIVPGVIGIIIIVVLISCFTTIPTGYVGIKVRFGKAKDGVISEGLHFTLPLIEKIERIDCRTKKIETTSEASTKDLQTVTASIAVNYNVDRENANKLYREVGNQYESILIAPAILESIKATMAQYTAEELITKRTEVSSEIQTALTEKISNAGFKVTGFNVTNIDFSMEYDRAIEAKAVKQQEVIAAQAELEKQEILNKKEIAIAEKDARVMELQNSQITENTLKLKRLEVYQNFIQKWNGVMPTTMLGDDINSFFNVNE
jgi:regulator of protease activity HflC (stomatin/prohibitin superfamily)